LEIAGHKFPDRVICAFFNFDPQGRHPETSFSLVAAELCRGLHREGLAPLLSTTLLAVQHVVQHVAPVGGGDECWGLVLDGLDKGVKCPAAQMPDLASHSRAKYSPRSPRPILRGGARYIRRGGAAAQIRGWQMDHEASD